MIDQAGRVAVTALPGRLVATGGQLAIFATGPFDRGGGEFSVYATTWPAGGDSGLA